MPDLDGVLTARIPELKAPDLPLHMDDRVPLWQSQNNKTVWQTLNEIRTYIETGGGTGSTPPVSTGNSIIMKVGAAEAGGQIFVNSALAGKQFIIRREGVGILELSEFNILSGGGFELTTPGDVLELDEVFEIEPFSTLPGTDIPTTPGSTSGSFINGYLPLSTNRVLDPIADVGKLLQIRANTTPIVITLPDVGDIPANTIVPIESAITNTVQAQVTTTGGQFIYMNNQSKTSVFIGPGEALWLFRTEDGYYVFNNFGEIYKAVGEVKWAYKKGINQIVLDGSLLPRISYPRLWEFAQTLGTSIVNETTWNTASESVQGRTVARPYRGCFSTGDGSTTFRVPDLMNQFIRAIKSESGTDTERHLNKPGGYQDDTLREHFHKVGTEPGNNSIWQKIQSLIVRNWNTGHTDVAAKNSTTDYVSFQDGLKHTGVETRGENVGMLPVMNY